MQVSDNSANAATKIKNTSANGLNPSVEDR